MRYASAAVVAALICLFSTGARAQIYIPTYQEVQQDIATNCSSCLISHYSPTELEGFSQAQLTNLLSGTLDVNGSTIVNISATSNLIQTLFPNGTFVGNPDSGSNPTFMSYANTNFITPINNNSATILAGVVPVTANVKVDGLDVIGSFAANSTTLVISAPALTSFGLGGFQMSFPGVTRQAAINAFNAFTPTQAQLDQFEQAVIGYWAATQPNDPLAGNPTSVQSMLVRSSMDLSIDNSLLDASVFDGLGESSLDEADESGAGHGGSDAGSWMIGAAYGKASMEGSHAENLDAVLQKNWRVFQGDRSRLQLSLPVSYTGQYGVQEFQGGASLGLEVPVIARRWSLAPQVGWGMTAANRIQSMGHLGEASLTSRYRIDGFGRGYFVIGDMIGYSETLSTKALGQDLNPRLKNWIFRNGVAYEMPLKTMGFGHALSARASYVETNFTGSPLFLQHYSEASFNIGVWAREGRFNNRYEMMRLGVSGDWGRRYQMYTTSIGWRF